MKVVLAESNTEEDLHKIYTACRTCYNAGSPIDMYRDEIDTEKKIKLVKQVISSGHLSTIEHVSLTFFIEGVSRSLTHQLVRHRLASYSQQSQRYVEFKDGKFDNVVPATIQNNKEALSIFNKAMEEDSIYYSALCKLGIPAEDARAILPNACATNISVTMNLRSFIHFCNERCCACAQLEIRKLAKEMAKLVGDRYPYLKEYFGPKCQLLGYCNEPKRRSCGRAPLKEDLFNIYSSCKENTLSKEDYDAIIGSIENSKVNENLKKLMEMKGELD